MNRVASHVAKMRAKCDGLEPDALAKLDADMAVDAGEHFAYQQAQAQAHVSGTLTTDEAQIVYMALGEVGSAANGGWSAGTDTPTKVSVTLLMGELLKHSARRMGVAV